MYFAVVLAILTLEAFEPFALDDEKFSIDEIGFSFLILSSFSVYELQRLL